MKFTCSRERLLGGLQIVGNVVSSRGMKPVYESILVVIRKGDDEKPHLQLQGTDLEVAIRFNLEDERLAVGSPGSLVVPAARLTAILREVDDEDVTFDWKDRILSVECRDSHFKVMGLPEEEFPDIPDFPDRAAISVPGAIFRRMVSRTAFATAREKMRYALNGVLVLLEGEKLQMVGTDGRRLAHTIAKVENPEGARLRVIVPTKGMQQMARILGEGDEALELALLDSQLAARSRHAVVISRLVEGTFPNFEEVIPVNCERRAEMDLSGLIAAVRKAALLTNRESQNVRFAFDEDTLALTSRAVEVGEARVRLPIAFSGEPADVAFNPSYVLEGLGAMESEKVSFEFRNPASPAKITDGEDFTYVVMPISLE